MFDLSSSKLFLLAVIALLVVGPKDLPQLLRTVGRYVGMIRRQASDFRAQFDDAMKESELSELKKQVEEFGREAESAVRDADLAVQKEADAIKSDATSTLTSIDNAVKGEMEARDLPPLPVLDTPLAASDVAHPAALADAPPPAPAPTPEPAPVKAGA